MDKTIHECPPEQRGERPQRCERYLCYVVNSVLRIQLGGTLRTLKTLFCPPFDNGRFTH